MTPCLFCGKTGPRAKEHVFPDWLLRALAVDREQLDFRHQSESGETISSRRHDLHSFRYGHVCAECNNTWMSQLEREACRILGGLWSGAPTIEAIDAYALTLWTLKTACVLNAASNYRAIVPREHAVAVLEMAPPTGVYVHLAWRPTPYKISWHQSQRLVFRGEDDSVYHVAVKWKEAGYVVAFGFAGVMLRLIYLPSSECRMTSSASDALGAMNSQIWPRCDALSLVNIRSFDALERFIDDAIAECTSTAA